MNCWKIIAKGNQYYYRIRLCGLVRDLPLFEVAPGIRIAIFNILGDTILVEKVGLALSKKLPKADLLVTAEVKSVPFVYEIARWRNGRDGTPLIPERVFARAPTAELRPGQRDSDSIPSYPVLDPVLRAYAEQDMSPLEIARRGFGLAVARRVARMVERSEYKRRQAPPGVKILPKAFGRDRRNPITHGFEPWKDLE